MVTNDDIRAVQLSFTRCRRIAGFFGNFYTLFMSKTPEIESMFTDTEFDKQIHLLRQGINFLIAYARGNAAGELNLKRIGQLHDADHLNVRPDLYPYWVDSLMETVSDIDTEFTPDVEAAWRRVLAPGIELLTSLHTSSGDS